MKKKLLLVAVLALLCTLFTCSALAWDCEVDGHVERTTLGKEKTCTVDGYTSLYCTKCGEITVEVYEIREATGHEWRDTPFKTTAATCNATGEERYMCKKCTEINVVTLPKDTSNHVNPQLERVQEPTCTESGSYDLVCFGCKATIEKDYQPIPATGHTMRDTPSRIIEPTCTEKGSMTYTCERCPKENVTYQDSLGGHSWGSWGTSKPATCLQDGQQKRVCSVCKAEETKSLPMVDHTWGEWTTDKAPGCETPGTRKHTCTTCSRAYETEEIAPIGHTAGGYIKVKEATCEETGLMQGKCVRCSFIAAEEVLPALGHDFTREVEVEPGCYQDGYTAMACAREGCEAVDEDSKKITQAAPMIHYTVRRVKTEGQSCLEDDVIYKYCLYCDYEVEAARSPSAKHTWGEWKVMNCQSVGTRERTCSACGEMETEFIGYRAHTYDMNYGVQKDGEFLKHPDGSFVRRCDTCLEADVYADWHPEYVGDANYCAQNGHGYDLVTNVNTNLTCDKNQTLTWKCAYCGDEKTEKAAFGAHNFSDWSRYLVNEVTGEAHHLHCVKDGNEMRYCKTCGYEETRFSGTKNHNSILYSSATEASCAADAQLETYQCQDCRYIEAKVANNPFPYKATGHSYVTIPAVPATATNPGLTAGVQCEKCGQWKKAQFKVDADNKLVSEVAVLLTLDSETDMVKDSYGNDLCTWTKFWEGLDNSLDDLYNEDYIADPIEQYCHGYSTVVDGDLSRTEVEYPVEGTDLRKRLTTYKYVYGGKTYTGYLAEDGTTLMDKDGEVVVGRVDNVGNIAMKLGGTGYTYVGNYSFANYDNNGNNAPFMQGFDLDKYLDDFYANVENGEELRARVKGDMCIAGTISAVSLHGNFDDSQALVIDVNEDGMVCPECSYPMTQWFNWIADQMKCFCTNTNCSHVEYTEP